MKNVMFLICCLAIAGTLWAQAPPPTEGPPVTVDIPQMPVDQALKVLFKGQPTSFSLEPDVMGTATETHLKDVPFEKALGTLLKDAKPPLTCRKDGNVYLIAMLPDETPSAPLRRYGRPALPGRPVGMAPNPPAEPEKPVQITMRIPAMPVEDAVAKIEPGWEFKDDLGSLPMPGASFYNFPKDMATGMVLIAAGLVPPTDGTHTVTTRGTADLQSFYQWIPPKPEAEPQGGPSTGRGAYDGYGGSTGGYGNYGGGYGGRTGGYVYTVGPQPAEAQAISIGAYQTKDGKTLLTVLSSQAVDYELLKAIFSVSGKNSAIGDLTSRPYYMVNSIGNGKGGFTNMRTLSSQGPFKLSVQIYDATLEQVLDSVTSAAGLKYHKEGPPNNPTYVIATPAPTEGPGGSPLPVTGKKVEATQTRTPAPTKSSGTTNASFSIGGVRSEF